jgi:nitroreductase
MDVLEAIRARRSIGRVGGDVDETAVRALIEAAVWAPNHRMTEPWRFTVVRGRAREALGRCWGERSARYVELQDETLRRYQEKEAAKPLRAPVLIVVSVRTDPEPVTAEEDFAATAAAVQNLLLAAVARGIGAIWRTGAMAHDPAVKAFLGLEPSDRIVGIVYLGTPAMDPPRAQPRQVDEVIRWMDAGETPR